MNVYKYIGNTGGNKACYFALVKSYRRPYTVVVALVTTTLFGAGAYTKPRKGLFSFIKSERIYMDRYAVFLDAGYFFSAGAQVLSGQQVPRKQISLREPDRAVESLCKLAGVQAGGLALLRIYWYDATPGSRPSLEQSTLAMLPCVKLRLGVLNNVGEQKGVDSLIVTDLIELARNRAIADAIIVSGDEDLRVAVQVAQSFGVRVHVLAAGDPKGNVSAALQMEADSVAAVPEQWFKDNLVVASSSPAVVALPTTKVATFGVAPKVASLDEAAEKVSQEILAAAKSQIEALKTHFQKSNSVPPEFDRRLIAKTAALLGGRQLSGDEMRRARGVFVKAVRGI
jgi:hypothetical protein